ncbi:unnamed protein product [Diatraea saccharalis]|uniref:Major facilitator superfamily (MFS) profile domain-containing protein n=1 Tax=Diatraea saccharalis TaxID=40085 RepID=A0A9P0G447_9NEOP|nr:unnamed protein product [Diatraea saccharalis]
MYDKPTMYSGFQDMFSVGLIIPQLHQQALLLGCSHVLIGIMGAVYSASQLISGPIIGNLSDLKGRKPALLFTFTTCGVAYLLLGITTSALIFFILRFILGVVKQTQLLTRSIAPDYVKEPEQHSGLFGKMSTLSGIGMSVGPMVSGHLAEAFPDNGFTIIAFVVAVIYTINTYLINILPDNEKTSKLSDNEENKREESSVAPKLIDSVKRSFGESVDDLKKVNWVVYWDVFIYRLIISLCMGMYFSSFAVFLKTEHNVSPKYLGYIIAFKGAISSFCTYFIVHINRLYKTDSNATERTFHVFLAITVAFLGMGLASTLYVYILFIIPLAVGGAVGKVTNLEMIVKKGNDEHRGSIIGAAGSVRSLSGVVTPLLSGIISEYMGVPYVIIFAAIFASIGVGISYKIRTSLVPDKHKND